MLSQTCKCYYSVVEPDGTNSLPTTPLSGLSNITFHPDMKPSLGTCGQHVVVTMATTVPTCSTAGGVIPSVVSSRNDVTVEVIPGMYVCMW